MKYIVVFLSITVALLHTSCGNSPARNSLSTVVSDDLVNGRIRLLDTKFSEEDICRDYLLAKNVIENLHNDNHVVLDKEDIKCPKGYKEFATKLLHDVNSLNDLHSTVLVGYGLDATSFPVVKNCRSESNECPDSNGSLMYGIPSPTQSADYAVIADVSKKLHFIRITSISGKDVEELKSSFGVSTLFSHNGEGLSEVFTTSYLKRSSLDNRTKDDFFVEGIEIATGTKIYLELSYKMKQSIFLYDQDKLTVENISVGRAYGCVKIFPISNSDFGTCINTKNKPIIWLSFWPQRDSKFINQFTEALKWVSSNTHEINITFDLRGNAGGSPETVVDLL
ncbi:MAG: hypothetical protein EOO43_23130, partial [Flavobacterium sp.]